MSRGVVGCDFCRCDSKLRRVFSRTCRYCHIRVSGCGVCLASGLVVIDFSRRRYQCVDRSDDSQCRRAAQAALRSASANDEDDDEVIGPSIARDDGQGDDQGDDDDDDIRRSTMSTCIHTRHTYKTYKHSHIHTFTRSHIYV